MEKMKEIRVTNIDPGLHKQFKTACADFGLNMREALLDEMKATVKRHLIFLMNRAFVARDRRKGGKKS